MAGSAQQDKQALVAELAAARVRLSATGEALRHRLDVPTRASENFRRHRPAWLGGAAIAGFLLSKIPSRKKTVFVDRDSGRKVGAGKLGAAFSAAKFAFTFALPVLSELAGGSIGEILRRFHRTGKPGEPGDSGKP